MRIIHLADIHWRGLSRHEEYRESFSSFFVKAKKLRPDVIYIGGDIVHSKTQGISPELIDNLSWWFSQLAKIAPTHIILGNHDGLQHNKDRQDAISPIINALDNDRLFLYKKSGVYPTGIDGYSWCVLSCFDEESWQDVEPVHDQINIALFHGGVWGSSTDIDWKIDGEVTVDMFKKYDFSLLGDIHRCQFLNDKKTIAYCGSSIQQNYGEDPKKGFLFWDIRNRDDFDVEFHEIPHSKPFITIDWQGSIKNTLIQSAKYPNGARFRIKSDQIITQTTTKQIQNELITFKDAVEVVFKTETSFNAAEIQTKSGDLFTKENLRENSTHKKLIRDYYSNLKNNKQRLDRFDELIDRYLSQISSQDESLRNVRWQIDSFRFDNTFAYGEGNIINFDNLPGITGIFGKNAKGKSSIIGALVYGLFNTTDRGPIKNVHIINSRKNMCETSINFSMNGKNLCLKRKTIKKQTKKGDVYGTTSLSLLEVDESGNPVTDLSGEQRRDTEKIVRDIIGTPEDFLMTSLASQGQMNTFIRERATARKMILTNFLDLNVFEKIYDLAKDESQELRAKSKVMPLVDWDAEIDDCHMITSENKQMMKDIQEDIKNKRNKLEKLNVEIAVSGIIESVTQKEIDEQNSIVEKNRKNLEALIRKKESCDRSIHEEREKILKIKRVKNDFPIDVLKEQIKFQRNLEKSLLTLKHEHQNQETLLESQLESIRKLEEVPCGDVYPTCKFIKQSHLDKGQIEDQKKTVKILSENFAEMRQSLDAVISENLENKIQKYDKLVEKESGLSVSISQLEIKINNFLNEVKYARRDAEESEELVRDMHERIIDDDTSSDVRLRNSVLSLRKDIKDLERNRLIVADRVSRSNVEINRLRKERQEFSQIKKDLKIYDMFMQAMSKKGIPLQIMTSQLPLINGEIAKILHGVTGFTVELEADPESNAMDIYINYGDSRRIVELASGMEKMMASLAIRVALINVSSLPKTNMLIIDEGFGALDETNIEACSRLLQSLKKWFRNIIVISHVDAIKDAVDNSLDIIKKEKNARVIHV